MLKICRRRNKFRVVRPGVHVLIWWGTSRPAIEVENIFLYCLQLFIHITMNIIFKNHYLYSSKNVKVLQIQWILWLLLSLFVIANFSGTCLALEILKGYKVRKRLGTPEWYEPFSGTTRLNCEHFHSHGFASAKVDRYFQVQALAVDHGNVYVTVRRS